MSAGATLPRSPPSCSWCREAPGVPSTKSYSTALTPFAAVINGQTVPGWRTFSRVERLSRCDVGRDDRSHHGSRLMMTRPLVLSITSLCLTFVAVVGLAGYTVRLSDDGVVAVSFPVISGTLPQTRAGASQRGLRGLQRGRRLSGVMAHTPSSSRATIRADLACWACREGRAVLQSRRS